MTTQTMRICITYLAAAFLGLYGAAYGEEVSPTLSDCMTHEHLAILMSERLP